ncbi:Programmed cell death protein 6 [Erysiphe neolycopersici]|uniref:Programmed cell death protein 6 n=1 Tax=Erysiphe neolycopersici TaxID=212602 RepID=A0A420HQM5_9PEZI|nr:Programmed cell death protein 6 [Erysiphe neolycopersici]
MNSMKCLLLEIHRHSQVSRPPASPPYANIKERQDFWNLYQAVDKDGNRQLTEKELRQALVNADWTSFDPCTVKMMIRLFDTNQNGGINFEEFCGLWSFLGSWRSIFDRFDSDKSGNISINEYANALIAFGYRLSDKFVYTLFKTYDKRGVGAISFDLFVQSCISLKRMTNVFKKYDQDRDGYITLSL